MADQATERTTVKASPERCFAVATDFERYPDWARDVKEALVRGRDDEGRGTTVAYRVAAMGRSARYTLAYDYAGAPRRLSWSLAEGDIFRRLDGTYLFEPVDEGTEVMYHLAVDLVIPLPGFVKRRAEGRIIGTALDELKRQAES
jgi:ribosome-associated toxin RatA of RatAB toxin-antitoxin module